MAQFEILNEQNAEAFFDLFMARKDNVLETFRNEVEQLGGPKIHQLDYSRTSLLPLWTWLKPQMTLADQHPPLDQMPPWYGFEVFNHPDYSTNKGKEFTPETAKWTDGLIYYFGETLIRNTTGLYWELCSHQGQQFQYKPWISGQIAMCPLNNITNLAKQAMHNEDRCDENTLTLIFDIYKNYADIDIRKKEHLKLMEQYGCPPQMSDFMRIETASGQLGVYHVYLSEYAEAYLGYFKYSATKSYYRIEKGVDEFIEQSHQHYIVHSTLDQEKLTKKLWKLFVRSAKEAKDDFE